jgi:hypothetical protein
LLTNAAREENDQSFMVARGFYVFNLAQVGNAPESDRFGTIGSRQLAGAESTL